MSVVSLALWVIRKVRESIFVEWSIVEKWREVVIFFISEPMSTTQPPDHAMSTDRSRRSSSRRSKRNSNEEEVLVVSKHFFTSKSSTCFTFGLNPANEAHKKVLCDGCDKVLSARGGILTKEIREAKRDSVGINKQCHQPWHPKYAKHREHGKVVRYNDFNALFKLYCLHAPN